MTDLLQLSLVMSFVTVVFGDDWFVAVVPGEAWFVTTVICDDCFVCLLQLPFMMTG